MWALTDQVLSRSRETVLGCDIVEKLFNVPAEGVDWGCRDEAVRFLLGACLDGGAVPQFPGMAFNCSGIDLGSDGLNSTVACEPCKWKPPVMSVEGSSLPT